MKTNDHLLTGESHPIIKITVYKYPWQELAIGDWFEAPANAAPLASKKNREGGKQFASVTGQGRQIVVRTK